MSEITEPAPAKINLTLRILGRRPDGFHALESIVAFAPAVADEIVLQNQADDADRAARAGSADTAVAAGGAARVRVTGPFAGEIVGENLLERLMDAVAGALGEVRLPMVRLDKRLPVAAGLGGGSADAAALMRALRRWLDGTAAGAAADIDWPAIAARLGSDVPVCLAGVPAVMRGRGEIVAPLTALAPLAVVVVNPRTGVPADKTAQVFRALGAPPVAQWDGQFAAGEMVAGFDAAGIGDRAALVSLMREIGNDLAAPAARVLPVIGTVLAAIGDLPGCRLAQMAGAGPTCFGVFDTMAEASAAAHGLARDRPDWWIAAARTEGA